MRGDFVIEGVNKLTNGKTLKDRFEGIAQIATSANSFKEATGAIISGLATLTKSLDTQIDRIAGYKTQVDTRLNGLTGSSYWLGGSY